jgi:hypothetical protein
MKNQSDRKGQSQIIPLLWVRRSIGFLGIVLPPALVIGSKLFSDCPVILGAVSDYYHSIVRDIFVGVICVIALFLFTYRGFDKKDDIAANLACIFALGIAFFPTSAKDINCGKYGAYQFPILHNICAVCFFLVITYFSLFLFTKTEKDAEPTPQKIKRNRVYRACGIIMLVSIILIGIDQYLDRAISKTLGLPFTIMFIGEWVALWAFGTSWIVKGEWILKDSGGKKR